MQAVMSNSDVIQAMEILFGEDFNCTEGTLRYIQTSGIKKAFRTKAMICHPDHAGKQLDKVMDFKVLQDAYNLLMGLKEKEQPVRIRPRNRTAQEAYRKQAETPASRGDFYYKSRVLPSVPLRLGEYLYYSGRISWRTLIDAIVEQRRGTSRLFGEYFIRRSLMSREELHTVLLNLRKHNLLYKA